MRIWLQVNIVKTLTTQRRVKNNIMPTVTYKCPDTGKMKKKQFAYNAVGKVQAANFAKMMGGKLKNNPGYGTEKTSYM